MPSNFAEYAARVARAARRADADATDAQREAGVARVGKIFKHGLEISITHPKGSIRRGKSPDGKKWERVVNNHYGYINKTTASDGEHFDVWIGQHPESQLAFTFDFLTGSGEHDETKAVVGVRNLQEARKVITANYPAGWLDDRIGEIRGYFMPTFRKWLKEHAEWKKSAAEKRAYGVRTDAEEVGNFDPSTYRGATTVDQIVAAARAAEAEAAAAGHQMFFSPHQYHRDEDGNSVEWGAEDLASRLTAESAANPKATLWNLPSYPWSFRRAHGQVPKAAASWHFCKKCQKLHKDRTEDDGCPECDAEKKARWVRFAKLADGAMMAPQPAGASTAGQYKPPPPPPTSPPPPAGNQTLGSSVAASGSWVGNALNSAPALPKTPPAQPVVSPPKPAAGANDDVSAMPKMYSEPGHSWLGGVNARTAPTSGTSMYRANAAPEEGVLQHLKTLPVRGVDRLNGWLHDSGDPHGRYMEALRGGENGQRPLLDEDALHNDPVSWQLFKEWAGGREFPVTQEDGDFVKNFQAPGQGPDSREVGLQNLAKYPPNFRSRPTGLTAIHEGTHYAQGRGAGGTDARTNWSELVPSLNDLPYLEEYTRRLQADRGRPVTGSGVTLTPPSGDPLSGATMHQQATEHGLFASGDKRRSMAELLNTEAGRAWLRRQAGGAQ